METNKKMTGIEYIQLKREQVRSSEQSWVLGTKGLDTGDEDVLKKTLDFLDADKGLIDRLIQAKKGDAEMLHPTTEFRQILEVYSDSLKDDLNVYTNNEHDKIVKISGLSILESGDIHAGCVEVDDYGSRLDGYAIFINLGTYYALQLLAKTIIVENFQNDFAQYRKKATEFVDVATNIYLTQDSRSTRKAYFDEYPPDIQAEASAGQSSVVVKVMQFIALHELGHIVNGDLEIMGFHRRFMNPSHSDQVVFPENAELQQSHDAEFAADMFAFNALFNYDAKPIQKWSGFYPIFYFLAWLDAIEKKIGSVVSNLHPNALERAKRMQAALLVLTEQDDLGYGEELEKVIKYFEEWSQS